MAYDGHLTFDTHIDEKGFSAGIDKLGSIAKGGLSLLGGAIAGVTAGMTAAIGASVAVGSEFEAQMSRVQAISGATSEEFAALRDQAIQLGADTSFSASSAAMGMENLAAAGFAVTEIMDAMPGMLDLAAASGEDLASSADIAASALRGFGLEASEAGHVADVLAANANMTNSSVADTGEALKYIAPLARAAGVSLEETAAAIGIMANAGIQGSQAGTTLRGALSRLSRPTDEMVGIMDKLGLSFYDSEGRMLSLTDQVRMLETALEGATDEERNNYLVTLYGQEALSGMLALINEGPDSLEELTKSFEECDGAAASAAATMQDNLQGAVEQMKGSVETLGILIYDEMAEPLKGLAQEATEAVNGLTDAFKNGGFSGLIQAGASLAANVLTGIAQEAPAMITAAVSFINEFVDALNENTDQVLSAGSQILLALMQGMMELAPTLAEFGWNIVSTLLASLTENAPMMMQGGANILIQLINGFSSEASALLAKGPELIASLASGISLALPQLVPVAVSAVLSFVQGLVSNIPAIIDAGLQILTGLAQGIANALPVVIDKAPEIINDFADAIYGALPKVFAAGAEIIITLGKGIINSIPTIIANAGEIAQAIINVFTLTNMFSVGKSLLTNLGNGIKSLGSWLQGIGKQIIEMLKHPFDPAGWVSIGKNIINGIANGMKNSMQKVVDIAKNVVNSALDAVKTFLGIHSPSRVFQDEVGKNIALGIAEGIRQNKDYAKASAEEIAQATLDAAKARLDNYKVYNNLTLADEAAYWDSVRQQVQEGTQARVDADEEYFKTKQDLNDKMAEAEEDYTKKVADAYEKLNDNIQSLNKEYEDALERRTDAIAGAYSLFDEFSMDTDLTSDDLLNNLQSQVDGLAQWMDNLDELSDRGVGDDLIAELQELGPKSAAQVQLLTEMTDDELDTYVNLFRQKNRLARSQALEELEPMRDDIRRQIAELKQQTQEELADYQQEYIAAMTELGVVLNQPAENLKLLMAQNAVEMVAALAQSIQEESGSAENTERFKAIANNILGASDSLPSELLYIGQTAIDSMAQGIMSRSGVLAEAVNYVTSLAVSQALASLSGNAVNEALYKTSSDGGPGDLPANVYGNEGYGPGYQLDYARMGEEMAAALNGVDVSMDGQKVGSIVSEPVNDNLGDRSRMEGRDIV